MAKGPRYGFYYAMAAVPLTGAGAYLPEILPFGPQGKVLAFCICLVLAVACVITGAVKEYRSELPTESASGRKRRMISIIGMLLCGVGFVGFAAAYFWPTKQTPSQSDVHASSGEHQQPLTMRQIFDSDFLGTLKIASIQRATIGDILYEIPCSEYIDTATSSFFFAFYIDIEQKPLVIADLISNGIEAITVNYGQIELEVTTAGSTRVMKNSNMRFSGQVYLYYAGPLSIKDKYSIEKMFERFNYQVSLYDAAYYTLHWKEFDRAPRAASESGNFTFVLPKATTGTMIRVKNNTGSLPPTTAILPVMPALSPSPPKDDAPSAPTTNLPAASPPSQVPLRWPEGK